MTSFDPIFQRAAERKGSEEIVRGLLPEIPDQNLLRETGNDRVLAEMTKCVFRAGFVWRVIEQKWPGFEEAFLGFAPQRLAFEPDEFWEKLSTNADIVRNAAKIMSVRHNAGFVQEIARAHGSFGVFLAEWPATDLVGLWDNLAKNGQRLGGMTGRYFVRFMGKDTFLPSRDVVAALRDAGLAIAENPTSKKDLIAIQEQINAWAQETGLPLTHISRILAMSAGDNMDPTALAARDPVTDDA